ncbi:MAG: dUTP diphosphatase [Pseudomonadales bacterium]|nr:dUTP diphosphatase [Pseudomonadales bacterium]
MTTATLTSAQAATMLGMQSEMNARVDPNWIAAAYPYLRAVIIESAEAIEHHGWKWWKKQTCDLPQLQMELIDIWHFLLSELLLQQQGDQSKALQVLLQGIPSHWQNESVHFDGHEHALAKLDLLGKLELLIGTAAANRIELVLFAAIMHDCQMDWQDVYAQYVGKNVLNFFRQDNGYKEGTYVKVWHQREDNEHLVEIMLQLDPLHPNYRQQLYTALSERYPEIL